MVLPSTTSVSTMTVFVKSLPTIVLSEFSEIVNCAMLSQPLITAVEPLFRFTVAPSHSQFVRLSEPLLLILSATVTPLSVATAPDFTSRLLRVSSVPPVISSTPPALTLSISPPMIFAFDSCSLPWLLMLREEESPVSVMASATSSYSATSVPLMFRECLQSVSVSFAPSSRRIVLSRATFTDSTLL